MTDYIYSFISSSSSITSRKCSSSNSRSSAHPMHANETITVIKMHVQNKWVVADFIFLYISSSSSSIASSKYNRIYGRSRSHPTRANELISLIEIHVQNSGVVADFIRSFIISSSITSSKCNYSISRSGKQTMYANETIPLIEIDIQHK